MSHSAIYTTCKQVRDDISWFRLDVPRNGGYRGSKSDFAEKCHNRLSINKFSEALHCVSADIYLISDSLCGTVTRLVLHQRRVGRKRCALLGGLAPG